MVDHLHLKYFVSAECLLAALKVFSSDNARSELFGTRERDNEDEKRYPVSGWNGCHLRADTMDTSPTSTPFGIAVRSSLGGLG